MLYHNVRVLTHAGSAIRAQLKNVATLHIHLVASDEFFDNLGESCLCTSD